MMKKTLVIGLALLIPLCAGADTICGPFHINWKAKDGFARVNGDRPDTQKISFLKDDGDYGNVTIQWMIPDEKLGRWLGMDFVARNGKPILNVEVVRTNMSQPREFWTYDCVRTK